MSSSDDLPDAPAGAAPRWDPASGAAGALPPAGYDYAGMLAWHRLIRLLSFFAALPFIALPAEYLLWANRFDADTLIAAGILLLGLATISARSPSLRMGAYLLYALFFAVEYSLLWAPPLGTPLPVAFLLIAAAGTASLLAHALATVLIQKVEKLPKPAELEGRIGRPFLSQATLQRVLEIYRTADAARANQAWTQQAGRQE